VVGGCVLGRCLCHVWRRRVLLLVVVGVRLLFVVRGRVLVIVGVPFGVLSFRGFVLVGRECV